MLLTNSDGSETYLRLPVAVYSLSSDLTRVYLKMENKLLCRRERESVCYIQIVHRMYQPGAPSFT